jgi:hypothetical protein
MVITVMICGVLVVCDGGGAVMVSCDIGQPNFTYSALFIPASNSWGLDTSGHAFDE